MYAITVTFIQNQRLLQNLFLARILMLYRLKFLGIAAKLMIHGLVILYQFGYDDVLTALFMICMNLLGVALSFFEEDERRKYNRLFITIS